MSKGVAVNGFVSEEELERSPGYPSKERMQQGPVVVIECPQEIPCNPCEEACPHHAISVGEPITNCPRLDETKCVGCGLCIPRCPGLAIFLIDLTHSDKRAAVSIPYEYLPLPHMNQKVTAVNRAGEPVCEAEVIKVADTKPNDRTAVVTVTIPNDYAQEVRGIVRLGGHHG